MASCKVQQEIEGTVTAKTWACHPQYPVSSKVFCYIEDMSKSGVTQTAYRQRVEGSGCF